MGNRPEGMRGGGADPGAPGREETWREEEERVSGQVGERAIGAAVGEAPGEAADRSTTAIRAEIEQTRADLTETIDAIQDKLRPANLVSQATETVTTATVERMRGMANTAGEAASGLVAHTREAAGDFVEGARENPIPAALIGIGAAWLLMNRGGAGVRRTDSAPDEYGSGTTSYSLRDEYGGGGFASELMDRVRNNPWPVALTAVGLGWLASSGRRSSRAESGDVTTPRSSRPVLGESERAASGYDRPEAGDQPQTRAASVAAQARRATARAQNRLQRLMQTSPLAVGAIAAAAGAAVGYALPETHTENEWMGEARENLVERAQDVARSAAEQVKDTANQAVDRVMKSE